MVLRNINKPSHHFESWNEISKSACSVQGLPLVILAGFVGYSWLLRSNWVVLKNHMWCRDKTRVGWIQGKHLNGTILLVPSSCIFSMKKRLLHLLLHLPLPSLLFNLLCRWFIIICHKWKVPYFLVPGGYHWSSDWSTGLVFNFCHLLPESDSYISDSSYLKLHNQQYPYSLGLLL